MQYVIYVLAALALMVIGAFAASVIRTAARQVSANRRDSGATVAAWWTTADPDAPVSYWPTYTDPRAVDLDALPVDEPLTGEAAKAVRDALRTPPVDFGRGYDELNQATGGRSWEELKRRAY